MKKMKKIILVAILLLSISFINTFAQNSQKTVLKPEIEIFYFHATGRCNSCLAVENVTKETLDENFKAEMTSGVVTFQSINFDEKQGRALADKYEVTFSTLLIIRHQPNEVITDFTNEGFEYALNNPNKFKTLLTAEIYKNLN